MARNSPERGTGLLGSVFGVAVFLALLTVAVQVLVDLYQTSVVTAAAFDVARDVAASPDPPPPGERDRYEARLRELLGGAGDEAVIDWLADDPDVVALRVVVPTRRFLLPVVAGPLGLDEVDRTIRVRVEDEQ